MNKRTDRRKLNLQHPIRRSTRSVVLTVRTAMLLFAFLSLSEVKAQRTAVVNTDTGKITGTVALYDVVIHDKAGKETDSGILYKTTDSTVVVMVEDYSMPTNDDARFSYKEISYKQIKSVSLTVNHTQEKQPDILIDGSRKLFDRNKASLQLKSLMQ